MENGTFQGQELKNEPKSNPFHVWVDTILKFIQLIVLFVTIPIAVYMFLAYETLQRDLALKNADVQRELAGIKLKKDKSIRFDIDDKISGIRVNADDKRLGLYAIDIKILMKNISDQTIIVPCLAIEIFVGRLPIARLKEHSIQVVNEPGCDVSAIARWDIVKWKLVHREISRMDEKVEVPEFANKSESHVIVNVGWGTGPADPGETLGGGLRFLLSAKPTDFLGYRIYIASKTEDGLSDGRQLSDFLTLSELTSAPPLQNQ
ncbi:hypothetical protein DSLASN_01620 [Desulfoluna limicola]|uniref:Uncharacterized protein n=1 Tax=Desulfoluna limicola TaxID=2810562 RepID=A0ABM7PBR7_9BACT|nr:hypothetical protein [Desulfoluna limicola]BCS94530.1 hypothetical protein DSLASN_01620 [Desulfoluna limicola]